MRNKEYYDNKYAEYLERSTISEPYKPNTFCILMRKWFSLEDILERNKGNWGGSRPRKEIPEAEQQQIIRLYLDLWSTERVRKRCNRWVMTILKILRAHNIPLRRIHKYGQGMKWGTGTETISKLA